MQSTDIKFQSGRRIVHSKYSVCHKVGQGQHSSVYSVNLKKRGTMTLRAIKVEHDLVKNPQILTEISVLKQIEGMEGADIGFAKLFQYGSQSDYTYFVMQLLGPNLQQLLRLSGGKLSLKTVLILGLQIIDRIQILHNAGFIYKDIKPQNFLMGLQNKSPIVHMIDFGKCKRYKNKQGKHIPYTENAKFDGDTQFCGLNIHNGTQYSRRDDIEAIAYMMIYLKKGKLPWSTLKEFKSKKQRESAVEQIKKKVPIEHLTYKLPLQFVDLLTYVRTLNFYEKPDYDYMRVLLHRAFSLEEDNFSMVFDWNKMDPLDFAIYTGEPRIIQRTEEQLGQQKLVNEELEQRNAHTEEGSSSMIRDANSLDMQLINDTNKSKDLSIQQKKNQSSPFDFLKYLK